MIERMSTTSKDLSHRDSRRCFVSGCFDLLHSGHIKFLQQAAAFGSLSVALGSDATIHQLKGRYPICCEQERAFMVRALRCVDEVHISTGSGLLDFEPELRAMRPHLFVVNDDGDHAAKRDLCAELGIEYVVLARQPSAGLPWRRTSELRQEISVPYRLDLAGGWLDQPFVSALCPGPVIVVSLAPIKRYETRSGLATSTRATTERLWGRFVRDTDPVEFAKIVFACENPPGAASISGSQDALGILLPGVNRLDYDGQYWPNHIECCNDPEVLSWLEAHVFLKWLGRRPAHFDVLQGSQLRASSASQLAAAAQDCWEALGRRDLQGMGAAMTRSFQAQGRMFPAMINAAVEDAIARLPADCSGYKLAGAGGTGYLVAVANKIPPGFESIAVRRS